MNKFNGNINVRIGKYAIKNMDHLRNVKCNQANISILSSTYVTYFQFYFYSISKIFYLEI